MSKNWIQEGLRRKQIVFCFLVVLSVSLVFLSKSRSRSRAIQPALLLVEALDSGDEDRIRKLILTPASLVDRAPAEQIQLLVELLESELSPEGLGVLEREGEFGPLRKVFPAEAETWSKPFSISPDECVAFRLARDILIAELVLYRQPDGSFRVLRVNDIRQLLQPAPLSANP